MSKPVRVEKYGVTYIEGARCPACSSERDKGGRLEVKKRTNTYLKCNRCKYSIHSTGVLEKQAGYAKKMSDKLVGLK